METKSKRKKSPDRAVVKDKSFLMVVYLKTELIFFGRVSKKTLKIGTLKIK